MGKRLVVLTGSSKGLGKALATQLLKDGETTVIGISRDPGKKRERYIPLSIDLADTGNLVNVLEKIFPRSDYDELILINNAGWIGEIAPIGKLNPSGILDIHRINVVAPAILMNAFVANYRDYSSKKTVINISSGAAGKAVDGWSGYCASKSALNQMTLVAQQEADLHHLGIRYIALSPGIIDTPMQEDIRSASPENFSQLKKFQGLKIESQLSTPEETAEKVIYLLNHLETMPGILLDVREF